jgi:hypothetical protein
MALDGDVLTETFEKGTFVWKATKTGPTFHLSLQSGACEVDGGYCK